MDIQQWHLQITSPNISKYQSHLHSSSACRAWWRNCHLSTSGHSSGLNLSKVFQGHRGRPASSSGFHHHKSLNIWTSHSIRTMFFLFDEWMNEGMNEWMNEWVNEWRNEWMSEWMKEWMKEWMNEFIYLCYYKRFRRLISDYRTLWKDLQMSLCPFGSLWWHVMSIAW